MDSDYGALVGIFIGLALILFALYIIFLLAMAVAGIAAIGGTLFGGGTAIGNYFTSFKENIIDSNKKVARP